MPKKLCLLISILLMLGLMLGGCVSGTGTDNHNSAAVLAPAEQINPDGEPENVPPGNDGSSGAAENSAQVNPLGYSDSPTGESGELTVHFIDVGQGDSILVQTPSGQTMLIDGGERDQGGKLVEYLQEKGISNIDILVGTHPHSDHIGGLIDILGNFPVNKIYLPKVSQNTSTYKDLLTAIKNKGLKVSTAKAGVAIPLESVDACFAAPAEDKYESLNNYSAVVKLVYGNNSFIFTGDAEKESEEEMLLSSVVCLKADVLKVGHHGSHSSTSDAFLKAVSPDYAVIMCGSDNHYGHPHKETIEALTEAGVMICRTDQQGNIVMTADGNSIETNTVKTLPVADESENVLAGSGVNDQVNGDNTYYIGNKNSKKFHQEDCQQLPAEHNRVYFKTREEAIEAGYVACGACQP